MHAHDKTKTWYEDSYRRQSFQAQRLYPNEELLRFFGHHFFRLDRAARRKVKVLEVGCGSCSNLWMVAREGFDAYGLDLSSEAIKLGQQMLARWNCEAELRIGSMTQLPYPNQNFDVVYDVVSSYCLNVKHFEVFLGELTRVLKPQGKLFMFTFSANSDAFRDYAPAEKIDEWTLNGIYRRTSPYYGNFYPFRFSDPEDLTVRLTRAGIQVNQLELINRTYHNRQETFQYISVEGTRVVGRFAPAPDPGTS